MIITIQNKRKYKITLSRLWEMFFVIFVLLLFITMPTIFVFVSMATKPFNIFSVIMTIIMLLFITPFLQTTWWLAIHAATNTKKPFFIALSNEFEEILQEWGERIE